MDNKEMLNGVGYCGLVCMFCNGCWECVKFPCSEGNMFNNIRVRSFVQFIKEEGLETFMDCIIRNQQNGITYGKNNDYDKVSTSEEVIGLINQGKNLK